ncbi:YbhB/YbcL family Raf kinase inhibitor-like protein [Nonomuraea sp. ATR24]|uniref:YbhB/YbcL family Raf kinase inhibitor-like protein n=1 Tax=unclassified Nonomuraea TaxID=2593643 RepID=UPI003400C9F7
MGLRNRAGRVRRIAVMVTAVASAFALSGCATVFGRSEASDIARINVSGPDLREGKPLPRQHSCKGTAGSPALRWSSRPLPDAKSIAIVVDSHTQAEPAVHWVIYNIPATTTELGPGASESPPEGSGQAVVTGGKTGYQPPCDDKGSYRFSVYTLSGKVESEKDAPLSTILKEIADKTIARGRLTAVDIE